MLVEDHPSYRESLALVFSKAEHIELTYEYGTAEQALHALQAASDGIAPDLILLDLNLPGLTGIEAIPRFKTHRAKTPIIILTQSDKETDILSAIHAGASGYLLKSSTRNQLIDAIELVMDGGAPIDPKVAKLILERMQHKAPEQSNEVGLSEREIEVLKLLGTGLLKKQIADQLDISTHTVGNHIRHIYEKLQVQNAPAAITEAYRRKIIPL